ncbi:hypothetical protein ACIRQP_35020 [Streptomyces sp. NPDC102274]|uniref:hypothetical protein n=1 Tax=Streptomyces sp. NPDC102274 TaxID=3366151 RepID=UPI00380D2D64
MPAPPSAQITLCFSRATGIVAIASGEQYRWAQTALAGSRFQRRDNGTYTLPLDDPETARTTLTGLVRSAERHQSTVATSSRRFIGDIAGDLVAQLPGQWNATVEVYSHPLWQEEDLVPWLWDSGELTQAAQSARVPYAARLSDGADINLLLIERPGHDQGYVIGAFAPEGFDDNYEEPNAPRSIVVPASPGLAARAVTGRFLPAYQRALHARRVTEFASALCHVRAEHETWQAIRASGRFSDATPLATDGLAAASEAFQDNAWYHFRDFLTHGPILLEHCRPAGTPWPEDTAALERLRAAVQEGQATLEWWNGQLTGLRETPAALPADSPTAAKRTRNERVWPAVETWLADGEALIRQAKAAAPAPQSPAPLTPATAPAALPPSHRATPHR